MAKLVLTDVTVTVGGVDYTDEVAGFTIDLSVDTPDVTTMDSSGWRAFIAGLKSYTIAVEFRKEADLSGLDLAIWTEIGTPTAGGIAWTGKQVGTATSAANPQYSGTLVVNSWQPLAGAVGDAFSGSVTWQGTGTLARATS